MNDKLKHQLYDYFLKDTPISFDSVTDKQWADMQATFAGLGITLSSIVTDVYKIISDALQPAIETLNDTLQKGRKK